MTRILKSLIVVLLLVSLLSGLLPPHAQAASLDLMAPSFITVETTDLANDENDGLCDLWEALKASFDQKAFGGTITYNDCTDSDGPTVITFAESIQGQTITLPAQGPWEELPEINDEVSIIGPITIDGGGKAFGHTIFVMAPEGILNLTNLTVMNGYTYGSGGAIVDVDQTTINLLGVSFIGNQAESNGGAIESNGTVNIIGSNFSGNRALGIIGVDDNPGVGFGGAISVTGPNELFVAGSTFNGNIADKGGGAIYFANGKGEVSDTTFNGNIVNDEIPTSDPDANLLGGGAILNDNETKMTITRVAFDGNLSPDGKGGAVHARDGRMLVEDSSFNANIAGDPTTEYLGGGLYNVGVLTVTRSAFIANIAVSGDGGGLANDRGGVAILANSTFDLNSAPLGDGGALWNGNTQPGGVETTLRLLHVTLSNNLASNASAVFNDAAGGHLVQVGNTIVHQGAAPVDNCDAALNSLGHNIDSGASCGLDSPTDQENTDPMLQALAFNGGPLASLLSHELSGGSPALDAGDGDICQEAPVSYEDQRGESRPKQSNPDSESGCDLGAIENGTAQPGFGSTPVQPGPIDFGVVQFGQEAQAGFLVYETGSYTLTLSNPSLGGSSPGEFALQTAFPITLGDGDSNQVIALKCAPLGPTEGERTAILTFETSDPSYSTVSYNLTCFGTSTPQPGFASNPLPPGPLEFGEVQVGDSGELTLSIAEAGDDTLVVSNPVLAGQNPAEFAVLTGFPINIPDSAAALDVTLSCTPANYGIRTATFTLDTNDPSLPQVSYNLSCQGVQPPSPYLDLPGQSLVVGNGSATPQGVAVSPDGRNVYVAANAADTVITYQRDPLTGELSYYSEDLNGVIQSPRYLLVSPDGKAVYLTDDASDALVVFERDPVTGDLVYAYDFQDSLFFDGLDGAFGLAQSPDGRHVYVASYADDAVAIFERDADGFLNYAGFVSDAVLDGSRGVAVSPDGRFVFVVGYPDSDNGQMVIYDRDAQDGSLTYNRRWYDGQIYSINPIRILNGLAGAAGVTVSPDGEFIYVTSYYDNAVVVFRHYPDFDSYYYLTTYADGQPGVDGLLNAFGTELDPSGKYLLVAGTGDDALSVFERDVESGWLSQVQVIQPDGSGLPMLDGAVGVTFSPDGLNVYATGYIDSAVVTLHTANPIPLLASLQPASARAGSDGLTLAILGEDFVPGALVYWNGAALETQFTSSSELQAWVPANKLANPGSAQIQAENPLPGGGFSPNQLTFTITEQGENPVPSLSLLSPASISAGSGDFELTLTGSNFTGSSVVRWNGADRPTTFISKTELQAVIFTADVAQPGSASLVVFTPAPGGGTSNALEFTIRAPGENPVPSLTALSPGYIYSRGAASTPVELVMNGQGFVDGAQVHWNGAARPTQFISDTQLRVTVLALDLAFPGQGSLVVVNPGPGGGESNALGFTIYPRYVSLLAIIAKN
jgi:predicted outer membrane repeat protein